MSDRAITAFHHVNLTVTDVRRSADWYREVLDLEPGWEMPDTEGRGQKVILLIPGTSQRLVLTQHAANGGEPFTEFATGLDHLAFAVPDRAALEDWDARLGDRVSPDRRLRREPRDG